MQKYITKFLILTIILTAALSVNYLFAAWVGPTQAPPGGNTSAPIHVGSTNQVKDGGLSINALSVFGNGWFQGSVQVGSDTSACDSAKGGAMRYNNTTGCVEYCDGVNLEWSSIDDACPVIVVPLTLHEQLFTSNGTFSVPDGVTEVSVSMSGGGGGGAGSYYNTSGGGGGAHAVDQVSVDVTGRSAIVVTVGSGGNGGAHDFSPGAGSNGTASSFGNFITTPGGYGGQVHGAGGSAGGTGGESGTSGSGSTGGSGGSSIFGNGAAGAPGGPGSSANGYGGGGAGAGSAGGGSGGGSGSSGFVLVEWYQ